MGRCVVQGCSRKSTTDKDNPVKIYSIPRVRKYDEEITSRRRVLWLKRLNISDEEMPNGGVCDAHFISGTVMLVKCFLFVYLVPSSSRKTIILYRGV